MEPKIHDDAQRTIRSSLVFTEKASSDFSVQNTESLTLYPLFPLTNPGNPIVFYYPGSQSFYINPRGCKLRILGNITKSDNSKLTAADKVTLSSNAIASIFESASMELNETPVTRCSKLLPYRDYVRKKLTATKQEKETKLATEIWMEDTTSDMTVKNAGHSARMKICKLSNQFEIYGDLCFELFRQSKAILPNCSFRLEFIRNTFKFCLNAEEEPSDTSFVLNITEATVTLERLTVHENIISTHNALIAKDPVCYQVMQDEARICHLKSGIQNYSTETLFTTVLPAFICCGITTATAAVGKYAELPFTFKNYGLTSINCVVDNQIVPNLSLQIDKDNSIYSQAYQALLNACGSRSTNGILIDEFLSISHLLCFELQRTGIGNTLPPVRQASLKLQLNFKEATTTDLALVVVAFYPNMIQVYNSGLVKMAI